jgi:hypothetical protein
MNMVRRKVLMSGNEKKIDCSSMWGLAAAFVIRGNNRGDLKIWPAQAS